MSNVEELLVQESTTQIISGGDPFRPVARSAHFLLPRGDGARPPALPLPPSRDAGPVLVDELQVELSGWPGTSKQWRRWVAKLRPLHEPLWRKVGILGALLATTSWVRRDEGLLLQLAQFWSADTSTFVFPWGEATVTLEDVAVLGGLPLLGHSVGSRRSDQLRGDVDALEAFRSSLNRSKGRKPTYASWVKHFVEQPTEEAPTPGDDTGGEAVRLLEHGAFLALWLSRYVFPGPPFDVVRPQVFPVAARLARGKRVALAPAALASIYKDLSALKHYFNLGKSHQPFVGRAPLFILQLWVWERFRELRPETENTSCHDDPIAPRAARWHNLKKALDPRYIHSVFISPEKFEWRPYGSSSFALPQGKGGCWVHGQDLAGSKELLSFAQCLRPCELVGMGCIEQYCPHRVARQLGFDQDLPRTVARANSSRKIAWTTYKMQPENFTVFIPTQYDPGVTIAYAQWWRPYLSESAAAVANAARMKQLHAVVSPRKRKFQGLPGVDSCKKRQSKARMTLLDDTEDPQDEIPLVKRLNSIILRQNAERYALKDEEAGDSSETVKDFVPRWTRKGKRKVIKRKVAEQAFSHAETGLVIAVDEQSCGSVSKNEHCKEQVSDSVITHNENNISSEHGDVEGAVSTGSNKGIGAAIVVDLHSNLQDILATSDDELDAIFREDSEVGAMYLKLSKLVATTSNSDQLNEERQVVTIRRDKHDCTESKDIMMQSNCDYELAAARRDTTLRQGPAEVTHAINVHTNVGVLQASTNEMLTDNVTEEQDHRAKVDRENSTILEGNNGAFCDRLVNGNGELGKREIYPDTLYYVIPFERVKDAQVRDSRVKNVGQGFFQPRREVGTTEMIREVFEAREAKRVELEAVVDRLKQQLAALEVQFRDRRTCIT